MERRTFPSCRLGRCSLSSLSPENRAVALTRHGKPVLAVMPWDLFESIMETMEIMGDVDMMAALRQGIEDVREGNLIPLEQVKAELA